MKKAINVIIGLAVATAIFSGCASKGPKTLGTVSANVKKPELIDHKNLKWNKDVPGWVAEEPQSLQKNSDYKDVYLFKFESPRSKSLEGAELWTKDFSVPSEMARMVKMRVESKAAAAAAGDKDKIDGYIEDVVKTVTDTKLSGFKKESDYWVQMRYFDSEGKPEADDFTYIILYSIPKKTLDRLINDAVNGADEVKPKTETEKAVRDRVREALKEGI
ncbi:hypothetical protein [Treponema pedis]|uniref:Lipoprotein n=2 Tax=Treponema pedis TaxID=409322 RepID=S6A292_9SPIR|nr:hypothetical protein [Treponema pedis]AGT45183.1 hypothetical protein TPE_2711 [Treponema pedis str. T A4]QOW60433.1 hypothetical protein IFE08_11535 [Treponema pedis]